MSFIPGLFLTTASDRPWSGVFLPITLSEAQLVPRSCAQEEGDGLGWPPYTTSHFELAVTSLGAAFSGPVHNMGQFQFQTSAF